MNCRHARSRLLEYLEARLPPDPAAAVREHLASCPRCRSELEPLRKTLLLTAGDEAPEMPISADAFLGNVRRRVRTFSVQRSPVSVRRSVWPALAAATVMLMVGILLLSRQHRPQSPLDDFAVTTEPAAADIIDQAGSESDLVRQIDAQSVSDISLELADDAELDDLIEELTPRQQEALVRELTRICHAPAKVSQGG